MDDANAGTGPAGDTGPETSALADELTRVRGRGLNEVDEVRGRPGATGRQEALRLPGLDRLRAARGVGRGSRALDLRVLLWDGLAEFGREFPGDAAVIRSLYFDDDGRPPPPRGASLLLRQARGEVSESAFRRRQRGLLERFAAFLLAREASASQEGPQPSDAAAVASPVAGAEEPAAPQTVRPRSEPSAREATPHDPGAEDRPGTAATRSRSRLAGAVLAVLVAAAAVLLTLLVTELAESADPDPGADETERADDGPVSAPIRFNSLGGTTSKVIDLYDDPRVPSDQATKTATYLDGQTSRAWCVTRGRTVTSDVARGEEDRSSDRWLLVDGPPDVTAYATLTYLDVDPADLARLPVCPADPD